MIQTGDVERVDVIEADHVLAAMQELGWMPGERPPALAAIQAKLRQRYRNGGHTNRLSRLREEAISLSGCCAGSNSQATATETAEVATLPEVLEKRLADLVSEVGGILTNLHNDLASYLASYRAESDRNAAVRIDTTKKSATERIAAAEEELNAALNTCNDSADNINELTKELADAQSTAAAAAGRAETLAEELATTRSLLAITQTDREEARKAEATATGRADTIERELTMRTARVTELETGLGTVQAAWAAAAGKVEALEAELVVRATRITDLYAKGEALTASAAKAEGRAEALGNELAVRTASLAHAEASLNESLTANTVATYRTEQLEAELSRLLETISRLETEAAMSAETPADSEPSSQVTKRKRQSTTGGE